MQTLRGGCHCGNIHMELELTRVPGSYHPRACDCSFCRRHAAAYLSDPLGSLRLTIRDAHDATRYAQGSGQAQLLLCGICGVLVGPLFEDGGRLYGAVNVNAIEDAPAFAAPQSVSPQALSRREKAQRWKELWFADVAISAPRALG